MKIEIELTEELKKEIFRQCLVEQYKTITDTIADTIVYGSVTHEALTNYLKNLIYWNSTPSQFKEFLTENPDPDCFLIEPPLFPDCSSKNA